MNERFKIFLAYGIIGLIKNKQFSSPEEEKRRVRSAIIFWIVAGAILLVAGSLLYIGSTYSYPCIDAGCFITKANGCDSAKYTETTNFGIINYSVRSGANDSCVLTKQIAGADQNENTFLKKVLEGKQMECVYSKGEFNGQWLTSMIEGLENCNGDLKDIIGQLLILI